jgi:hypothetical protein
MQTSKQQKCHQADWCSETSDLYSVSHSRVAPENVGLQKEEKYNIFACHICNEMRLCVLGIRKNEVGNMKKFEDKIKIIKMKRDGYATCLPLALSVSCEERCEVLAFTSW